MSEALFYDPAVLNVVRAIVVSRGIRAEQDLEDAIGEVVLACIEYVRRTGRPPEDVAQAIAIARLIANRHGVSEARKRVRRGKRNVRVPGDADEHGQEQPPSLDPVDQQRMLGAIRQVLKDDQIEALSDVGVGVTQAQLAAESGAAPTAVRKRVQASRRKAVGALSARGYWVVGGFAALLAGSIAVYVGAFSEPVIVGRGHPSREGPEEQAAAQRGVAADACGERRWDECEEALNRAARLDPESDRAAEVKTLRAAIAAGRLATGARDGGALDSQAPADRR
jgi:hypothetical protein